jgi:hypothetical protein
MIGSSCGPLFSRPLGGLQQTLDDVKKENNIKLINRNDNDNGDDNRADNDYDINDGSHKGRSEYDLDNDNLRYEHIYTCVHK